MNGPMKTALCLGGILMLAACSGAGLERAKGTTAQGTEFDRALHDDYVALSQSEFDQGDYRDSDRYAARATAVSKGEHVRPEMIEARQLPPGTAGELTAARERLTTVIAAGAAERKPVETAQAQASFDCWMEQQEENIQPEHIAACRDNFMMSLAALEEKPKVAAAAPPPAEQPTPGPYTVLFDFDKASLTPDARTVLADVIKAAKQSGYQSVSVSGYTDLVGGDQYNDQLSRDRADAVVDFLVGSGLEKEKIIGHGFGKSDPVVPIETPEMLNRRVEIKFAQ